MNLIKTILFTTLLIASFDVCSFAQAEMGELLARWNDSSLIGSSQYNNTYNEIWGLAINNKEYAVIGTTRGTHFIDVTDPTDVYEAYVIDGATMGPAVVHRDYHDLNGYLYIVCDEGLNSTLQIVDISTLAVSANFLS